MVGEVDSTNEELRRAAARGAPGGTVVVADSQRAGRGRRGRRWHSAAGRGLYLSLLVRPAGPPEHLTRWTIAAAVAAGEACRGAGRAPAAIEWPNDVVCGGRKLGGVLVETRSTADGPSEAVVGIGINLDHAATDFPEALRGRATSLALEASRAPRRERLAAALVGAFAVQAARLDAGRWEAVVEAWERLAPAARGRRVRVEEPLADGGRSSYVGRTAGLDRGGALRVLCDDGRARSVRTAGSVAPLEE